MLPSNNDSGAGRQTISKPTNVDVNHALHVFVLVDMVVKTREHGLVLVLVKTVVETRDQNL